jgi:ATP-dependent Clp protease ATP-binding subunit ClpA
MTDKRIMLNRAQKSELMNFILILGLVATVIWIVKNSQSLPTLIVMFIASGILIVWRGVQIHSQVKPRVKVKKQELENLDVLKLAPWIKSQILGHDQHIDEILKLINRNINLFKTQKLLSKFLLVGPTGTGKTYLAEVLSQGLFSQEAFLFIPMSQYQQAMGAENIFLQIREKLKTHSHFVLLLDEIDRSHPGVREALLHYLDRGEIIIHETGEQILTPGVILIATTNAGAQNIDLKSVHDSLEMSGRFDRAFLARFDGIYPFKKLSDLDVAQLIIKYLNFYFNSFSISVAFMEPEVLIEVIKSNREFEMYGLRHLLKVIQSKSDSIIYSARKKGIKQLKLIVKNGEIQAVTTKRAAS